MNEIHQSWDCKSPQGKEIRVDMNDAGLTLFSDGSNHTFSFEDIFEQYNPLGHLIIEDQAEILQFISTSDFPQLKGKALHCLEFWKCFPFTNLPATSFAYETKVTHTYKWKLDISSKGLSYTDISGDYGYPGTIHYQTLADFWFYGPLMPVPDLSLRKSLIDQTKEALGPSGFTFLESHFPLISYPEFISPPEWVDGDYIVSDFVILRSYGVEYGRQNFHDGLVFLNFVSFEQCLTRTDLAAHILTAEIIAFIKENL